MMKTIIINFFKRCIYLRDTISGGFFWSFIFSLGTIFTYIGLLGFDGFIAGFIISLFAYGLKDKNIILYWGVLCLGITICVLYIILFNNYYDLDLDMASNIPIILNNNLLKIDLKEIKENFGTYENYINKIYTVDNDFIENNFQEYKDDLDFIKFISYLDPIVLGDVISVKKLYLQIIKYNDLVNRVITFSGVINKEISNKIFRELKTGRSELVETLKVMGIKDYKLNEILKSFNSNIRNQILLNNDVNNKYNQLLNTKDYINYYTKIVKIIKKDSNFKPLDSENTPSITEELIHKEINSTLLELYSTIDILLEYNLDLKKQSILELIIDECTKFSKIEKIKSYQTKKKVERKKSWSIGEIMSGYCDILFKYKKMYSDILINLILKESNLLEKSLLSEIKNTGEVAILAAKNKIHKDHTLLIKELNAIYACQELIYDLSKSFIPSVTDSKIDKFNESILQILSKNGTSHDELFTITKAISSFNLGKKGLKTYKKEEIFSRDSYLYKELKSILDEPNIKDERKQILIETFILKYEKDYSLHLIKAMEYDSTNFSLLTRIFKHSTPAFESRVSSLINNNKIRGFELYNKKKNDPKEYGNHLALAVFLLIRKDQLTNIIFSKIIKIIGMSVHVKYTDFISQLTTELLKLLNYNYNKKDVLEQLSNSEQEVVKDILSKLKDAPNKSNLQLGLVIMEFILTEFGYIFEKEKIQNISEGGETIYINIKKEYLAILSGSVFNPIRLPMVCKPKQWGMSNSPSNVYDSIGGYYLTEYNELNGSDILIHQGTFNKNESLASITQIKTINFLNSKGFKINTELLEIYLEDWDKKDLSILFKGENQLHPLTSKLSKLKGPTKIEIMAHNSKYWSNLNILNIALLLKDQEIFFPTFLDFRGRIYPSSPYFNYQSSDLARSLLFFSDTSEIPSSKQNEILKQLSKEGEYNLATLKEIQLKCEIDYVKLYLANVFGKDKLSRTAKIKWFDLTIKKMIRQYDSNFELFIQKFVLESKEPYQFISIFLSYKAYIQKGTPIQNPILFDATCSGIQHLSALTQNVEIAALVNLLDNEEPSDFYQFCINKIKENLKKIPDATIRSKFNQLDIKRNWLKQSIMTVPYNVTILGISDKLGEEFNKHYISQSLLDKLLSEEINYHQALEIQKDNTAEIENKILPASDQNTKTIENIKYTMIDHENLDIATETLKNKGSATEEKKGGYIYVAKTNILKKSENNLYFTSKELFLFSKIVHTTVLGVIPSFLELKTYLGNYIKLFKKYNLPVSWETPTGFNVSLSILEMEKTEVRTSLIKKSKPIAILSPTEELNYKKIKLGLMPNLIHSLDASNIHLCVENILKQELNNINLYTIHDCFASDYKSIGLIEVLVKHSFIQLYLQKDYLSELHSQFIKQISTKVTIHKEINLEGIETQYIICSRFTDKGKEVEYKEYLPKIPKFKWEKPEIEVKHNILKNNYFIS